MLSPPRDDRIIRHHVPDNAIRVMPGNSGIAGCPVQPDLHFSRLRYRKLTAQTLPAQVTLSRDGTTFPCHFAANAEGQPLVVSFSVVHILQSTVFTSIQTQYDDLYFPSPISRIFVLSSEQIQYLKSERPIPENLFNVH
jgi:hypothetical protein